MNRRRLVFLSVGLAGLAVLAGCGSDDAPTADAPGTATTTASPTSCPTPSASPPARKSYTTPPALMIDPEKTYTAKIATSLGEITLALDPVLAPNTVNNFVFLACERFYDGLTWHRVVEDFVIQGGDPDGNGTGGPGYEFADELPSDGYIEGSLAMANSGPDTNGSQFFIVTGANGTTLPNSYSKFGTVTAGLNVAKKIEALADPADPSGAPKKPVLMKSVTITEG